MISRERYINRFNLIYVICMYCSMMCISIYEATTTGNFLVTILAGLSGGILLVISLIWYIKVPDSNKQVMLLIIAEAITYSIILIHTKYTVIFIFAFLTNACVILLHDKTTSIASNVAIITTNTIIFSYRIINGTISRTQGILMICITLIYCLSWLRIMAVQRRFVNQDKEIILEQKQEQIKKVAVLEDTSKFVKMSIHEINSLSQHVQENMKQTTEVIENISLSSQETADNIQKQTGLTSTIQDTIIDLKETVDRMQKKVEQSVQVSEEGQVVMESLSLKTNMIVSDNEEIVEKINGIGNEVVNIKGITDSITNITSKTNLLALNASIEAARAGEVGKGFAVVAEQIRQLASDTKTATSQIGEVLDGFVESITDVGERIKMTAGNVNDEAKLMADANEFFRNIGTELQDSHELAVVLYQKSDNLIESNEQFMEEINKLSTLSEEVSDQTENTVSVQEKTYQEFINIVNEIDKLVKAFHQIC